MVAVIVFALWFLVRRLRWQLAVLRSYASLATISSLDGAFKCYERSTPGRAQSDALEALRRAAGCMPVDYRCWHRLFQEERRRHGMRKALASLEYLRAPCG